MLIFQTVIILLNSISKSSEACMAEPLRSFYKKIKLPLETSLTAWNGSGEFSKPRFRQTNITNLYRYSEKLASFTNTQIYKWMQILSQLQHSKPVSLRCLIILETQVVLSSYLVIKPWHTIQTYSIPCHQPNSLTTFQNSMEYNVWTVDVPSTAQN